MDGPRPIKRMLQGALVDPSGHMWLIGKILEWSVVRDPASCLRDIETVRQFPMSKSQTGEEQKITIAPMLSVRNGARAIEFYKAAFGDQELYRVDGEGGAVVAQLSVGESEFWLADESPEHLNFS